MLVFALVFVAEPISKVCGQAAQKSEDILRDSAFRDLRR